MLSAWYVPDTILWNAYFLLYLILTTAQEIFLVYEETRLQRSLMTSLCPAASRWPRLWLIYCSHQIFLWVHRNQGSYQVRGQDNLCIIITFEMLYIHICCTSVSVGHPCFLPVVLIATQPGRNKCLRGSVGNERPGWQNCEMVKKMGFGILQWFICYHGVRSSKERLEVEVQGWKEALVGGVRIEVIEGEWSVPVYRK